MLVYDADARQNTRQLKRLAVMSEANAPTITVAAIAEAQALQSDFFNLFQYIERFREEISHINASEEEDDDDAFSSMSQQLDAIVDATETATNGILENLDDVMDKLRESGTSSDLCDQVSQWTMNAMKHCTFETSPSKEPRRLFAL